MKKLFITLAAVLAFAACSDDEPAAWEKLPTAPISGENATLTVNGSTMGGGKRAVNGHERHAGHPAVDKGAARI